MMEKSGIIATDTAIGIGYEKGGYDYITATEFDKNGKHKEIWEAILQESENQKNPSFTEIEDKTLAIKNTVDSGDIVFLEGHAVGWYQTITKKLSDLGLPTIGLGWIGMSEKTSFERQTVSRGDVNTIDEMKRQQAIELAKNKAQDAVIQGRKILEHRDNAKKDPSFPPFYTFGAIGRSKKEMVEGTLRDKSPEQIKTDIEEFTKNRANYIFELANRQHDLNIAEFNYKNIKEKYEIIPNPENEKLLNLAKTHLKNAKIDLQSLSDYGLEGWNEVRNGKNGQEVRNEKIDQGTSLNSYNEELLYFEQNSETKSLKSKEFLKTPENKLNLRMINARKEFEAAKQQKLELQSQNITGEKGKYGKFLETRKDLSNLEFVNQFLKKVNIDKNSNPEKFANLMRVVIKKIEKENLTDSSLLAKLQEIKSFDELINNFKIGSENALEGIKRSNQEIFAGVLRKMIEKQSERENKGKDLETSEIKKSKPQIA